MKKLTAIIICLLFSSAAFAQDNDGFFKRMRNWFVVHDTVYINVNSNDTITNNDEEEVEDDEEEEFSEGIPVPIDTLNTTDWYTKVVLFDNGTWLYYNIERPDIPDSLWNNHWDTETVHSYRDVALKDLPDSVMLTLVDSVHRYCIPHSGPITSQFKFRWRRPHRGVDIGLHTGDVVYAAFDGVVRVALPTSMTGGYGNVLVIRHMNGLETYYGHLSDFIVKSGDFVKAGEPIGYGGSTGRSPPPLRDPLHGSELRPRAHLRLGKRNPTHRELLAAQALLQHQLALWADRPTIVGRFAKGTPEPRRRRSKGVSHRETRRHFRQNREKVWHHGKQHLPTERHPSEQGAEDWAKNQGEITTKKCEALPRIFFV